MCTLTYRLTESGYELFFNRDEQRSREQAIPPEIDAQMSAIYPIDPNGKGTWLAVHQSGLSLALLNYYQAEKKHAIGDFKSRGEIILSLLNQSEDIFTALKAMPLNNYQAFQLCVFSSDLSLFANQPRFFQWDGENLTALQQSLPITSSGVDYAEVYQARKETYHQIVTTASPTSLQLRDFHQSKQVDGKLSVQMSRVDAKTVSFSHILVGSEITFNYLDYLNDQPSRWSMPRIT